MSVQYDFSGVWRSSYHKTEEVAEPANDKSAPETEQYVTMRQIGNQLIIESIPGPSGSYLLGRLTLDDRIATGSYQSQNSPNNSTKDALYYGAAQLVLSKDGRSMSGMGVGYGKDMKVKSTKWELVHIGQQPTDPK